MIAIPSEEELTNELFQEIRKGLQVQDSFQQLREVACSRIAQTAKDAKDSAMGKVVGVIPQTDYINIAQKYGAECWDDRSFVKDFFKKEPGMKVHSL